MHIPGRFDVKVGVDAAFFLTILEEDLHHKVPLDVKSVVRVRVSDTKGKARYRVCLFG